MVEDDDGDVLLAKKALLNDYTSPTIHHVWNGLEALKFLRKEEPYATVPRPDLILLDLNMPCMDGREVLTAIKLDADLRSIPIVVLTTSDSEIDIVQSYGLQASCYITKPVDFEPFVKVVKSIQDFWFTIVKLPQAR